MISIESQWDHLTSISSMQNDRILVRYITLATIYPILSSIFMSAMMMQVNQDMGLPIYSYLPPFRIFDTILAISNLLSQ